MNLPDERPVLAKVEHQGSLGKSTWFEVVYYDEEWKSFAGSKTFEDGEQVVGWTYVCNLVMENT